LSLANDFSKPPFPRHLLLLLGKITITSRDFGCQLSPGWRNIGTCWASNVRIWALCSPAIPQLLRYGIFGIGPLKNVLLEMSALWVQSFCQTGAEFMRVFRVQRCIHGTCIYHRRTWERGSIAVAGRPGPAVGFALLASLLEVLFLIRVDGSFLPLDCVFPVVKLLVSISPRSKRTSHII